MSFEIDCILTTINYWDGNGWSTIGSSMSASNGKQGHTIFIIVFQKNADGKTKGGASSQFDAPVAIDCYLVEEDFPRYNYAKLTKNRGNIIGKYYNIVKKKTYEGSPALPEEI